MHSLKIRIIFVYTCSLRDILDSLLLGALSADKTDIVLNFPNLAVGGAYLPPTSDGRLLAIIHQNTQNGVETIEVGGANGDGDVLVDIEGGVANSSIQLTVYSGNEFFTNSNCSNNSQVGGDILGPIISVVNERTSPRTGDDEVITIRYNQLSDDRTELVCVRWTTDQECENFHPPPYPGSPSLFPLWEERVNDPWGGGRGVVASQ